MGHSPLEPSLQRVAEIPVRHSSSALTKAWAEPHYEGELPSESARRSGVPISMPLTS